MCCLPHTTGITFQWKLESAAWPALVLALAILGVGLAQGYLRKNAQQQVQSPVISDGPP
jgi:hypothetical protein